MGRRRRRGRSGDGGLSEDVGDAAATAGIWDRDGCCGGLVGVGIGIGDCEGCCCGWGFGGGGWEGVEVVEGEGGVGCWEGVGGWEKLSLE